MIAIDVPSKRRSRRPLWSRLVEAAKLLLGGPPVWVKECWSAEMSEASARWAGELQPDVVHFEFHVMAQYIASVRGTAPAARCIVTEHEPGVLSANSDRRQSDSLRQRLSSFPRQLAWARYERRALRKADAVVTFTEKDARTVRELIDERPTEVSCIPLRLLPLSPGPEAPIRSDLLFVGAFRHPPNADAAIRLAKTIFPRVRQVIPGTRLSIVGADPPPELVEVAANDLEVTGRVKNVAPYLAGTSVVICPLRLGGGMRVKILEACAFGKALIASPEAVEGLGLRPGIEFICANSDDEFVESALDLLSNPARRHELERGALDWSLRTQDLQEWAGQYEALYSRLIKSRPGAPALQRPTK